MPKAKTVSLKGAAARALFLQLSGHAPQTEEEALQSIATRIHAEMVTDNLTGAVAILRHMKDHGPMKTAETLAK